MATGKKYYWLKLKDSFMTSDTVDYFMSQPNGANYVVLYQMLCLKTINTDGRLTRQIGEVIIPYDIGKIKRDCKWFSEDTIRVALKLYQSCGLIYEDSDGTLVMTDHANLVGMETDYADQKRRQLANKASKMLPATTVYPYKLGNCTVVSGEQLIDEDGNPHFVDEKRYGGNGKIVLANANCTCQMCGTKGDILIHHNNGYSNDIQDLVVLCKKCHGKVESGVENFHTYVHTDVHTEIRDRDKRLEIRDKSKEIDTVTVPSEPVCCTDVQRVADEWNTLASYGINSISKINSGSKRQKNITARIKQYGIDTVIQAIDRIRNSDFLQGKNDRNWVCTFDWFILPNNFPKVLEGNYDNKGRRKQEAPQTSNPFLALLMEEGNEQN